MRAYVRARALVCVCVCVCVCVVICISGSTEQLKSEVHIIWYHGIVVIIYIKFLEETVTNMNKGMTAYE